MRPGLGQPFTFACVQAHAMHAAKEVLPVLGLNVPAGQSMQTFCDEPVENLPAGHRRQDAGGEL